MEGVVLPEPDLYLLNILVEYLFLISVKDKKIIKKRNSRQFLSFLAQNKFPRKLFCRITSTNLLNKSFFKFQHLILHLF